MGAINANWNRWVFASCARHVRTAVDTAVIPTVIEFLDRRSDTWKSAISKAEVNLTGPAIRELSAGVFRVWADIFIILSTHNQPTNLSIHMDNSGILQNMLDQCIEVKTYGDPSPVTVGFLLPRVGENDTIRIEHIKPNQTDQLIHSTIEARYVGLFTE